ncbi:hypothetical protein AAFC00_000495 [Neodothiora populina]|uniref:Nucleotide-diphospho-sugar transferase n=1 Tax=Neodothiora populina TaxID=2781224 RepID=A0ABR3PD45_9PEZI
MLFRPGKLSFIALFVLLVYGWTQWSPLRLQSKAALHRGWDVTKGKVAQGASFADDFLERVNIMKTEATSIVDDSAVAPTSTSTSAPSVAVDLSQHDDSPYAYVFYVTQDTYACSALVNIERLQNMFKTKHRIFVLASPDVSKVYIDSFEKRSVKVSIQQPPKLADGGVAYYQDCLLKLHAFNMHHIYPTLKKVIAMDSDQLIMQNLDHLFESSVEVDLAAPRAYWIAKDAISSTFMLISLSDHLWGTVSAAIANVTTDKYDMDLVNDILGDTVMMLPGSYVTPNSHWEDWNLPKWFHTPTNATAYSTFVAVNATTKDALAKKEVDFDAAQSIRHGAQATISAIASNIVKETSVGGGSILDGPASSSPINEFGREAEQTRGSSGDIFDYLEDESSDDEPNQDSGSESLVTRDESEDEETNMAETKAIDTKVEFKFQPATLDEMQQRPFFHGLYSLYPAVSVLHFFGLGKPWSFTLDEVNNARPGAHPLFVEQFRVWRETALHVCPSGILDAV